MFNTDVRLLGPLTERRVPESNAVLDAIATERGLPTHLRYDNGPEFTGVFRHLFDVRAKAPGFFRAYNGERPHSSPGYLTPAELATRHWEGGGGKSDAFAGLENLPCVRLFHRSTQLVHAWKRGRKAAFPQPRRDYSHVYEK